MTTINDIMTEDRKLHDTYCQGSEYIPLIYPKKKRIVVFGDLHGDFDLTIDLLKLAGVINNDNNWIGKDTFIVQVGDQLDNCRADNKNDCKNTSNNIEEPDDLKVFNYMTALHKQAVKSNGAVISLLGNHELMNVNGDFRYVSPHDLVENRKNLFAPGNEYSKKLACDRVCVVIIGGFLFVHAGIVEEFIKDVNITDRHDLYKIGFALKQWLLNIKKNDKLINYLTLNDNSMFWNRTFGEKQNMDINSDTCKHLDKVLKIFKVGSMVIGHTPQFFTNKGINNACNGKVWRVDTGSSFSFNTLDVEYKNLNKVTEFRKAQALEILDDKFVKVLKRN